MASATNQSSSIIQTLSNVSPVKMLSGVISNIETGINTITNSVGIGNIFSVADAGLLDVDMTLPIPNVLHGYATYNYIIGLGCLDPDSYNYPGSSYMAGIMPPLICKSASSDPNNRIELAGGGKFDFFIDDLTIEGYSSFTQRSGNTNNTNIEFTVTEPYSMGMFMQALQTAAFSQGYKNWSSAPYLLSIQFKGNTDTGQLKSIPNTAKYIPIKLSDCNMKVTESGAVYQMKAYASNGEALNDANKSLKSDATISGKTVQEVLQSGPKSLQQVVNARYKELKDTKAVKVQDEILILFPSNISTTLGAVLVAPGSTESKSSATTNSTNSNDNALFKTLGVSRSSSSASLIQNDGTCNELGKAKIGFDSVRGGTTPFPGDNKVWDYTKKIWARTEMNSNPGTTDFKFNRDSDIINAINQVMLTSEIAVAALDPKQIDKNGFRPWWRIDTQVYYISSDANLKTTGDIPKLFVYRVIPYKVHASKMLAPNAPAPGLNNLKNEVVKEYNYMYTGKNVDLLRFEFEMSQAWFTPASADNFSKGIDVQSAQQNAGAETETPQQKEKSTLGIPQGSDNIKVGQATTVSKPVITTASTLNKGGTRGETEATAAARLFHDAVINSKDMQNITFDILGDPYYIASSGCGNYVDTQLTKINITKDGSINYLNGEAHVIINFRTPTDINQTTGFYNLKNSELCQQFSGLFKLTNLKSEFKHGEFKQTLEGYRVQGQDSKDTFNDSSLVSANKEPVISNGMTPDLPPGIQTPNIIKSISSSITPAFQSLTGGK